MKRLALAIALLPLWTTAVAQQAAPPSGRPAMPQHNDIHAVAPALEHYAQERLFGDV
jgi:hypothetical protein